MKKLWIALVVLVAALVVAQNWLMRMHMDPVRVELSPAAVAEVARKTSLKDASMKPGRVVVLNTNKGEIDFILFEDDCPKTTARIAELVEKGRYNGIRFPRVEDKELIQSDQCKVKSETLPLEVLNGLRNAKGAVGMARLPNDINSATNAFYILMEPMPTLDYDYAVFGRLVEGMDVVMKIRKGDIIKDAKIRALTDEDRKNLRRSIEDEAERRTQ